MQLDTRVAIDSETAIRQTRIRQVLTIHLRPGTALNLRSFPGVDCYRLATGRAYRQLRFVPVDRAEAAAHLRAQTQNTFLP